MKKIMLMMAMTVLATGAISAKAPAAYVQQGQGQLTAEERAARQIKMMTGQLSLTADQATKLQPIILARTTEQTALREKLQAGNREAAMAEYKKLNDKYNTQIKAVLTAEQYTKYEAGQAQMRGGGQRQRPGGGKR